MAEQSVGRPVNLVFYSLSGGVHVTIASVPFNNPAAARPCAEAMLARLREYKIHSFGYLVVDVDSGAILEQG